MLFKKLIRYIFNTLGFHVTNLVNYNNLVENAQYRLILEYLVGMRSVDLRRVLESAEHMTSQYSQDIVVLALLNFKRNGYFVEFGAADGIYLSNSYMLERDYDWSGIVAEPARGFHNQLTFNRNCEVDLRCVTGEGNQYIDFEECADGILSTIQKYSSADGHKRVRKSIYPVKTVSLQSLLEEHNAPKFIDFLSIDTEGSELEILSKFFPSSYEFGIILVEHNFSENRDHLYNLLTSNGYWRVFTHIKTIDDWYIHSSMKGLIYEV